MQRVVGARLSFRGRGGAGKGPKVAKSSDRDTGVSELPEGSGERGSQVRVLGGSQWERVAMNCCGLVLGGSLDRSCHPEEMVSSVLAAFT